MRSEQTGDHAVGWKPWSSGGDCEDVPKRERLRTGRKVWAHMWNAHHLPDLSLHRQSHNCLRSAVRHHRYAQVCFSHVLGYLLSVSLCCTHFSFIFWTGQWRKRTGRLLWECSLFFSGLLVGLDRFDWIHHFFDCPIKLGQYWIFIMFSIVLLQYRIKLYFNVLFIWPLHFPKTISEDYHFLAHDF